MRRALPIVIAAAIAGGGTAHAAGAPALGDAIWAAAVALAPPCGRPASRASRW